MIRIEAEEQADWQRSVFDASSYAPYVSFAPWLCHPCYPSSTFAVLQHHKGSMFDQMQPALCAGTSAVPTDDIVLCHYTLAPEQRWFTLQLGLS